MCENVDSNFIFTSIILYSGADLASLVREGAVASLRSKFYSTGSILNTNTTVTEEIFVEKEHFDIAFTKVSPSVLPHVSDYSAF